MSNPPLFNYPDLSGTTQDLIITTNTSSMFFTGVIDNNTIDVQININGDGFISDPSFVFMEPGKITIPNPNSYPNGFPIEYGSNTIEVRSVDISGSVSPASVIKVTGVNDFDLDFILAPPTGIELKRRASTVDITWSDATTTNAVGYNIYASTGEAGTGSGYLKLNLNIIPASSPKRTDKIETEISSTSYDFSVDNFDNTRLVLNSDLFNSSTNEFIERKTSNEFDLSLTPNYRYKIGFSKIDIVKSFVYNHDRTSTINAGVLNSDTFSLVPSSDPIFYVITAVYFDKSSGTMQESRYSLELSGSPLPFDKTIRGLRIRDQKTVVVDYVNHIQKAKPKLSLIPASTVREVHIEPFANEAQKMYFLMDFVHRAKSYQALLAIDDPTFSGTSVPVANSQYKQNLKTALSVSDDTSVQAVIDAAFDSLAINDGITRDGARVATVKQTFYLKKLPLKDYTVNQGSIVSSSTNTSAPKFTANGTTVLSSTSAQSYYNPNKKRWEITVDMTAVSPGIAGNVAPGDLDTIASGANGFFTINEESGEFGLDRQSNLELAESGMNAKSSVDTGTYGGYLSVARSIPNLLDARVIESGNKYMMRDWDPIRKKHIGGKVDIYIKGVVERTVTERFAFQFDVAKNIRFDVIDPVNLVFRARDSRLNVNNPIQEMMNDIENGFGLRNHSDSPTGNYDLSGVIYVDYRTIKLNKLISQPNTILDDFVEGDYRYRSNSKFKTSVQPIRRVTSVTGEVSGVLDSSLGFTLYKLDDPLIDGESANANDFIQINQVGSIPNGEAIPINDEQHVLIGEFAEPLNSVGINEYTLHVYNEDRSIEYDGPDSLSPDYYIEQGSQTSPIKIIRSSFSNIPNGSIISVDYEHDENFSVVYVVNDVLQRLQTKLLKTKHLTADVLAKQSIENPLYIESTVVLKPNSDIPTSDSSIRNNYSNMINNKSIGGDVHQSDITSSIESSLNVDFIVQPFARMTLQDGAMRVRDPIPSDSYTFLSSLSSGFNAVYILSEPIPYDTIDGGGPSNVHHGVYIDDLIMEQAKNLQDVGTGLNKSWIIGKSGAIIPGYSDDATLQLLFTSTSEIEAERLRRTANKVVVSLDYSQSPPDVPSNHNFSATFIVNGDKSTQDVIVSDIEQLMAGNLVITYKVESLWQ